MAIDSLLKVRDTLNWVDRTDNRDFISQPNSPILESEKRKDVPLPIQNDWSLNDYFEAMQSEELKKVFFYGLLLNNKKHVIRFGIKNALDELLEHLNNGLSAGWNTTLEQYIYTTIKESGDKFKDVVQNKDIIDIDKPFCLYCEKILSGL